MGVREIAAGVNPATPVYGGYCEFVDEGKK